MELFDFDKNLNGYAQEWYGAREGTLTDEEMEDALNEIFEEWAETDIAELGQSPREYFAAVSDDSLVELFLSYSEKSGVPSVLTDEMGKRDTIADRLIGLLKEITAEDIKITLMNVLNELRCTDVYPLYITWLLDDHVSEDVALMIVDIMHEGANIVIDELEDAIHAASETVKKRIADLIVYAKPSDKGYALIEDLFKLGKDRQLYAAYLGMYGDERAIPLLKEAAKTCNYVEFTEIRNAVERLGGEWDVERDFETDPLYHLLKGGDHGNSDSGCGEKQQ